jgi:hypothetical protein
MHLDRATFKGSQMPVNTDATTEAMTALVTVAMERKGLSSSEAAEAVRLPRWRDGDIGTRGVWLCRAVPVPGGLEAAVPERDNVL